MAKFFMFGKYSAEATKDISAERTGKALDVIQKFKGNVEGMYALLGEHDLVLILDLSGTAQAMQVSVALNKLTGIGFTTAPAISVEEFDELMEIMGRGL
jgi:uncharacterized protein with GYD domain